MGWAEGTPVWAAGRREPEGVRSLLPGPSDRAVGAPGFTARPRRLGAPAPPAAGTWPPASSIPVHSNNQHTLGGNWALGRRQPAMPPGVANQTRPPERATEELTKPSRQLGPRERAQSGWAPRRPQQSVATSLTFRVIAGSQQPQNDPGKTQERPRTVPGPCLILPGGGRPCRGQVWLSEAPGRMMTRDLLIRLMEREAGSALRQADGWFPTRLSFPGPGVGIESTIPAQQDRPCALGCLWNRGYGGGGGRGGSQPLQQGRLPLNTWARGDCCGRPTWSSLSPGSQGSVKSASTQTKGLLLSHLSPQMGMCHPEKPRFRRLVGPQGHALVRQEPRARPGP